LNTDLIGKDVKLAGMKRKTRWLWIGRTLATSIVTVFSARIRGGKAVLTFTATDQGWRGCGGGAVLKKTGKNEGGTLTGSRVKAWVIRSPKVAKINAPTWNHDRPTQEGTLEGELGKKRDQEGHKGRPPETGL